MIRITKKLQFIGVLLMPLNVWASDSQVATHGYDLQAAYEFATPYIPTILVASIVLKPSQLPEDVRTKASFMKKFKVRDDLALRDEFVYADACDKMTAYFLEESLIKIVFEQSSACD